MRVSCKFIQFLEAIEIYIQKYQRNTHGQKPRLKLTQITGTITKYRTGLYQLTRQFKVKTEISYFPNDSMYFPPIKQLETYTTILQSNLLQVDCKSDRIQFLIFNFDQEHLLNHSHFLFKDLQPALNRQNSSKTVSDFFNDISKKTDDVIQVKNQNILLRLKLTKAQEPLIFQIPLIQTKISPNESINFLKQFSKAKQTVYKSEILRLKTKIYSLMTNVEDATSLIRAHSLQTKNSKEQIKNLKKELKLLQDQKKKQQQVCLIEVGVQHENSSQRSDIVEWLQCPEVKQFSIDEEKLKNLTKFIENQIQQNQKIISLTNLALPHDQSCHMRPFSERIIVSEEDQKQEEMGMTYSPQKVCFFEKSNEHFRLQAYSLKTLQSA